MISVIMANYNCEAFLASAIRSVLNQTNTALELILVDDGSSDRSVEIAQ
ncbi:MAG TPA: glycosyltransferase family 2 protein, partial [Hyphomonas sp.]|nr:glycosyltransferase family 2 protein [Hyphomonas sp.]